MIARMPAAPVFHLSERLGRVSLPDPDLGSLSRAEELDHDTVLECLQGLGRSLGLTLLARSPAAFPDSEAPAADAAFPDAAVRRSFEGLDAVWMRDGEPVACFVIESGFGGWQGVLRLADLVALHPKLKAPLYAVTLPALKAALTAEAHRPAFALAKKPVAERLRLIEWDRLRGEVEQMGERVRYLKPEFIEGISEPVTAPGD
jgi:hypothetical protein